MPRTNQDLVQCSYNSYNYNNCNSQQSPLPAFNQQYATPTSDQYSNRPRPFCDFCHIYFSTDEALESHLLQHIPSNNLLPEQPPPPYPSAATPPYTSSSTPSYSSSPCQSSATPSATPPYPSPSTPPYPSATPQIVTGHDLPLPQLNHEEENVGSLIRLAFNCSENNQQQMFNNSQPNVICDNNSVANSNNNRSFEMSDYNPILDGLSGMDCGTVNFLL